MEANYSDLFREKCATYLEPVLQTAAAHQASKSRIRTKSRYIRAAVIEKLIRDGYPLGNVSNKFDKFIELYKGMTPLR